MGKNSNGQFRLHIEVFFVTIVTGRRELAKKAQKKFSKGVDKCVVLRYNLRQAGKQASRQAGKQASRHFVGFF